MKNENITITLPVRHGREQITPAQAAEYAGQQATLYAHSLSQLIAFAAGAGLENGINAENAAYLHYAAELCGALVTASQEHNEMALIIAQSRTTEAAQRLAQAAQARGH